MATISYNDGNTKDLLLEKANKQKKLMASVNITLDSDTPIGGFTVISVPGVIINKDVECSNVPVAYVKDLDGKKMFVSVDLTKWQIQNNAIVYKDIIATCTLTLKAGSQTQDYELSDRDDVSSNSVFEYLISFKVG